MPRLLSWNVNGLRAFLKRQKQLLPATLEALGADIICFQETKLTKAELDSSLAIADGWDSFFSCTHGKSGYSGTATFCRSCVTVPCAAEEGVTGVLQRSAAGDSVLPEVLARFSREELKELDAEGRCVITDHGAFVLFNIYGPAIGGGEGAEERFAFKLAFYDVVHLRIQKLQQQGRCVVVVGDLNISPAPMDSCCSGTGENLAEFKRRRDRVWLNSLLAPQGPFVDLFRTFHPDRREAYTCWNQASGARVNNYGSRIDLILVADSPVAADCQLAGSRHGERGARGFASQPGQGSGQQLLASFSYCDISPEWQGSDHAPVWADFGAGLPLWLAAALPALASKHLFTGKQQSMKAFLRGRQLPSASQPDAALSEASPEVSDAEPVANGPQPPAHAPSIATETGRAAHAPSSTAAVTGKRPASGKLPLQKPHHGIKRKRLQGSCQQSMRSFLSRSTPQQRSQGNPPEPSMPSAPSQGIPPLPQRDPGDPSMPSAPSQGDPTLSQAPMAPPLAISRPQARMDPSAEPDLEPSGAGRAGANQDACFSNPQPSGPAPGSLGLPGSFRQLQAASGGNAQEAPNEAAVPGSGHSAQLEARDEAPVPGISLSGQSGLWSAQEPGLSHGPGLRRDVEGMQLPCSLLSQHEQRRGQAVEGGGAALEPAVPGESGKPAAEDAASAWKRIQTRMQPPKCFGHAEDCVIRQVKKGGQNQGRLFYVCARPDGPKPHGRCDHFVWCDNRRPQSSSGASAGQRKATGKRP